MMKHASRILMILAVLCCLGAAKKPVRILMAGDSTMAWKPAFKMAWDSVANDSVPEAWMERGWGMLVPEFFTDDVEVVNLAQNGRSTNRFIREGWWNKLMSQVRKGDYVVIQFAHNDGAKDKPDRYTTPEEYEANLVRMIKEVRSKGGHPILCTAVMRRKFDANGKLIDTHGVYPGLTRKVAAELKVPCIDMQQATTGWLELEGIEASASNFHQWEPGVCKLFPRGLKDNTHFNEKGARKAASLFVEGLKEQRVKGLTKYLKN